jgi:PAS domain S-box-containing protein
VLKSGRQPETFYQEMWTSIASGSVWQGELVNRRKDGTFYTEEMSITPVRAWSGEITSYIAIKQDVTERRAAEDAQKLLAAIVESSEDAILAHTPDGIILTWNRGAEAIFGYTARETVGKPLTMLIDPDRHHAMAAASGRVLGREAVSQFHETARRKDGRQIYISVSAYPIRNSAGDVTAVSAVVRDVTERVRAEQTQALLASIIESSHDAILSEDLEGVIVSWNKGAELLFGYMAGEIVGRKASLLAPPGCAEGVRTSVGRVRQGGTAGVLETVCQSKDGRLVDVSLSLSPIRNSGQEVVGVSVIARDIGDRKRPKRR